MGIVTNIKLLKNRRTKILATLGPASDSAEVIKQLIEAGANVFRLNMSHGEHSSHENTYNLVRSIADELGKPIAILADLCGPKIRTGRFKDGQIILVNGDPVTVTTRDVEGEPGLIPSQYKALADDVKTGNRILLNDGNLELKVESVDGSEISCTVVYGGVLKNNKGINLPGVNVSAPSLTDKDREDAQFALGLGVDFMALSFVRCAEDINDLKAIVSAAGAKTNIIAKIEKPEALDDIDGILDAADGIMVARGDLGVELKPEQVPVAQSQLIDRARQKFKPVIVATQMLESMIENARPTRAEVTDIAYAVTLGADAVMLSAESAAGSFPVESVQMMDSILRQTEAHLWQTGGYGSGLDTSNKLPIPVWESMANASNGLARDLMARALIVISQGGMSAATISSARPAAPVIAISNQVSTCRKMAMMWSIIPVLVEDKDMGDHNNLARKVARDLKLASAGDTVLMVKGFHKDPELNCPSVTIVTV
ncbi:MAG: pyruvate kinase [Gammaproteobacteria bacterium]|jgi:pyruvate kinase